MPDATQLPLQDKPHRNHFLFSDYYLDHRIRERAEWVAERAAALAAKERIRDLWRGFTPDSDNEAQTEQEW